MRAVVLVVAAVLLASAAAHAQINVPHIFLGFTSATFNGGVGVFAYQGACAVEFPNSRMCTSLEILTSPTTPTGLTGTAWVQPSMQPIAATGSGTNTMVVDASGVSAQPQDLTCSSWGSSSGSGLHVTASGRFHFFGGPGAGSCSLARSISCCGPPIVLSNGDLNADGVVNVLDDVILRRMLAGVMVVLP